MTRRDRTIILVLVTAAVLAGFWFVAINPKRKEASKATVDLAAQQRRLDQATATVATAQRARAGYAADYAALAELGKAVPADEALPSLLYQLQWAAEGAKIDFRSLKVAGASSAAGPPAAGGAGKPSGGSASKGGGSSEGAGGAAKSGGSSAGGDGGSSAQGASSGSSGASAAPSPAAGGSPPAGAAVGTAGLATVPLSFVFEGGFLRLQRFLKRIDRLVRVRDGGIRVDGRLLSIDGIGISPGRRGFPAVKATIAATAYVLPADAGGPNVPGPPGAAGSPADGAGAAPGSSPASAATS